MYHLNEDFSRKTIPETLEILARIKGPFGTTGMGLIGNSNITYPGTTAADCITKGQAFSDKHDEAASGDHLKVLAAKGLMDEFHVLLKGIAKQSNLDLIGEELFLESTGLPLAKEGTTAGVMDKAVINSVNGVDGVTGRGAFDIVKTKKFCHGTYIEVQDVATGIVTQYHTQEKYKFFLDVFTRKVDYMVRVCYDGTDKTKVWSDWKPFLGQ